MRRAGKTRTARRSDPGTFVRTFERQLQVHEPDIYWRLQAADQLDATLTAARQLYIGAMRLLRAAEPWDRLIWRRHARRDGFLGSIAHRAVMEAWWAGDLLKAAEAPRKYFVVRMPAAEQAGAAVQPGGLPQPG